MASHFRPSSAIRAAFVAFALLATSCSGGSHPAPTLEPEPTSAPAAVIIEFDPGISAADRVLVRSVVADSRRFYVEQLGRDLQFDITVHVVDEDAGNLGGISYGRGAWIYAAGWQDRSGLTGEIGKAEVIAHELFHNFQSDFMVTDDAIPGESPWWLVEGSAEYAALRYLSQRYDVDWQFFELDSVATADRELPPLDSDVRHIEDFGPSYTKAFLAVDRLMTNRPFADLADYFAATGGMDWEDAFLQVFAIDPAAFLAQFEADYSDG